MKKWMIAMVTIVCIAAFVLSACGKNTGTDDGGGSVGDTGADQTFDVGSFTVLVPAGWTAFPQNDIFGEKDEDGNFPIDPTAIVLAKDVRDEFEAMTGPSVRINYYDKDAVVLDSRGFYDDVEDITGVTINDTECSAFSGTSLEYTYQFITYNPGDAQYEISILVSVKDKETGITWEDPDVKAILESIQVEQPEKSSE